MDRPEDEELFDSRSPPWTEQDEGLLPEAQLLADTTAVEEILDAPEERIPQVAPRPEGDAGEQVAAEPVPAPRQTGREQRMEKRRALRNQQNGVPMGQEVEDQPPLNREQRQQARAQHRQKPDQTAAWRPPIFDQFQAVNSIDLGESDEIPLGEPREVAREDPQVAMNDTMGLAEAAYQNAEVAGEQARYLHNTMSRLRDTEVGFMTKNYV